MPAIWKGHIHVISKPSKWNIIDKPSDTSGITQVCVLLKEFSWLSHISSGVAVAIESSIGFGISMPYRNS